MSTLRVKNWSTYQHYKDRCPPWIKLSTDTFQNYEFSRLQDASKLLAICIWTLASRSKGGEVPNDFFYLKQQGCLGATVKQEHLEELIKQGFVDVASDPLADRKQTACSEGEGETETEGEERRGDGSATSGTKSPEPPSAVLTFPCRGKIRSWDLTEAQIAIWSELYPGLDVRGECRRALAWVLANSTKTADGMEAYLVRWMNTEINRGHTRPANGFQRDITRGHAPALANHPLTTGEQKI